MLLLLCRRCKNKCKKFDFVRYVATCGTHHILNAKKGHAPAPVFRRYVD